MQWLIDIIIAAVCPPGMIMLWHGSEATIPSGWAFCDGTQGTPDLKTRFIEGSNGDLGTIPPGQTGGSLNHAHTFTGDGHAHVVPIGDGLQGGPHYDRDTTNVPAVGTTDIGPTRPLYYALCYIMKL